MNLLALPEVKSRLTRFLSVPARHALVLPWHATVRCASTSKDIKLEGVTIVRTVAEAERVVKRVEALPVDTVHAWDTEVIDLDLDKESPVGHGKVICASFYSGPNVDYGSGPRVWIDALSEEKDAVLIAFKAVLESQSVRKVWHNYGFDRHILYNHGIDCRGFWADTMHMARLHNSSRDKMGLGGYSLAALSSSFLGGQGPGKGTGAVGAGAGSATGTATASAINAGPGSPIAAEKGALEKTSMMDLFGVPRKKAKSGEDSKIKELPPLDSIQTSDDEALVAKWIRYSTLDAELTWHLFQALLSALSDPVSAAWMPQPVCFSDIQRGGRHNAMMAGQSGQPRDLEKQPAVLWELYERVLRPFGEVLTDMEREGIGLDHDKIRGATALATQERDAVIGRFRSWAVSFTGKEDMRHFNMASDQQRAQLLFGLPPGLEKPAKPGKAAKRLAAADAAAAIAATDAGAVDVSAAGHEVVSAAGTSASSRPGQHDYDRAGPVAAGQEAIGAGSGTAAGANSADAAGAAAPSPATSKGKGKATRAKKAQAVDPPAPADATDEATAAGSAEPMAGTHQQHSDAAATGPSTVVADSAASREASVHQQDAGAGPTRQRPVCMDDPQTVGSTAAAAGPDHKPAASVPASTTAAALEVQQQQQQTPYRYVYASKFGSGKCYAAFTVWRTPQAEFGAGAGAGADGVGSDSPGSNGSSATGAGSRAPKMSVYYNLGAFHDRRLAAKAVDLARLLVLGQAAARATGGGAGRAAAADGMPTGPSAGAGPLSRLNCPDDPEVLSVLASAPPVETRHVSQDEVRDAIEPIRLHDVFRAKTALLDGAASAPDAGDGTAGEAEAGASGIGAALAGSSTNGSCAEATSAGAGPRARSRPRARAADASDIDNGASAACTTEPADVQQHPLQTATIVPQTGNRIRPALNPRHNAWPQGSIGPGLTCSATPTSLVSTLLPTTALPQPHPLLAAAMMTVMRRHFGSVAGLAGHMPVGTSHNAAIGLAAVGRSWGPRALTAPTALGRALLGSTRRVVRQASTGRGRRQPQAVPGTSVAADGSDVRQSLLSIDTEATTDQALSYSGRRKGVLASDSDAEDLLSDSLLEASLARQAYSGSDSDTDGLDLSTGWSSLPGLVQQGHGHGHGQQDRPMARPAPRAIAGHTSHGNAADGHASDADVIDVATTSRIQARQSPGAAGQAANHDESTIDNEASAVADTTDGAAPEATADAADPDVDGEGDEGEDTSPFDVLYAAETLTGGSKTATTDTTVRSDTRGGASNVPGSGPGTASAATPKAQSSAPAASGAKGPPRVMGGYRRPMPPPGPDGRPSLEVEKECEYDNPLYVAPSKGKEAVAGVADGAGAAAAEGASPAADGAAGAAPAVSPAHAAGGAAVGSSPAESAAPTVNAGPSGTGTEAVPGRSADAPDASAVVAVPDTAAPANTAKGKGKGKKGKAKDGTAAAKEPPAPKPVREPRKKTFVVPSLLLSVTDRTPKGRASGTASAIKKLLGKPVEAGVAYQHLVAHGCEPEAAKEACGRIGDLLTVSALDTILETFLLPLAACSAADPRSRVHCSLNLNTETGRLSARRPNLQNQPSLERDRFKIRQAFVADPGKAFVVADYGQLELRVLAHLTNCASMIQAFKLGGDFHSRTAMGMYEYVKEAVDKGEVLLEWPEDCKEPPPKPLLKDKFKEERRKAKILNFSIAYGKTPFGLSKDWGVSLQEAEDTVNKWYSDRPEVRDWQTATKDSARRHQRVYTILGRHRDLPGINSRKLKAHLERASINTPIQGSAADIVMCAMLRIARDDQLKALGYRQILQVHDEVVLEGPEEHGQAAKDRVVELMGRPFDHPLLVDLAVDAKVVKSWGDAK